MEYAADLLRTENEAPSAGLLPVTVLDQSNATNDVVSPSSGVMLLTVGAARLRIEGDVNPATLAQVLARLLP